MEDLVASTFASELKVPHLVARFLVARGLRCASDAYHFLYGSTRDVHSPWLMLGMESAVDWILKFAKKARAFSFLETTTSMA